MLGKMTGAAAIVDTDIRLDKTTGRLKIWTSLKILGKFGTHDYLSQNLTVGLTKKGLYVSDLKKRSIEDDFIALIFGRVIPPHCVKISDTCGDILEIDTVRAWNETDSQASVSTLVQDLCETHINYSLNQWSNEVNLEIVIR